MLSAMWRFVTGCLVLVVAASLISGDIDCVFKDVATGKVYDLRPLIAANGSYTWEVPAYVDKGDSLVNMNDTIDKTVGLRFQLQICRNILIQTLPKKCDVPGAVYVWDSVLNTCTTWGNADVSMFSLNPFKDGVFLQMYGGSVINHWTKFAAHIYFVCNANVTMTPPKFEHMKSDVNQAHFKIFTKYVC